MSDGPPNSLKPTRLGCSARKALLNYLDLFINQQVRSGRYQELYDKWVGGAAPNLVIDGVYR